MLSSCSANKLLATFAQLLTRRFSRGASVSARARPAMMNEGSASPFVMEELGIYRTANVLIHEHGGDVALETAQRAATMLECIRWVARSCDDGLGAATQTGRHAL